MKPDVSATPAGARWRPGSVLSRSLFVIATVISMIMLFAPASDVPAGPEGSDKLVHCLMFAALLCAGAYARVPLRFLAPALVAYGGIAELIQGQIGRDADFWDWACDSAGVVIAVAVVLYVRTRRR